MNDQEILRRDKIIYRYVLGDLEDSRTENFVRYYYDVGLLTLTVGKVCTEFDVELRLIPVQEPKGWFIANIGGSVSPKFFLAKAAIFVALSNFLETKQ